MVRVIVAPGGAQPCCGRAWPLTGLAAASSSVFAGRQSLAGRPVPSVPTWSMFQ
jgi:hypothetical protein